MTLKSHDSTTSNQRLPSLQTKTAESKVETAKLVSANQAYESILDQINNSKSLLAAQGGQDQSLVELEKVEATNGHMEMRTS